MSTENYHARQYGEINLERADSTVLYYMYSGVLDIDAFVFSVSLKSKIGWSLWRISS
jgi:hypothetical protein